MTRPLFPDEAKLAELCRRHAIRRLALFGSTLKGTDRPDSDVDLLVDFYPGREPGLIRSTTRAKSRASVERCLPFASRL